MSMNIAREGSGYRIRLSNDRDRIIARTTREIVAAVRHYYDAAHSLKGNAETSCPICRAIQAKQRRTRPPKFVGDCGITGCFHDTSAEAAACPAANERLDVEGIRRVARELRKGAQHGTK